MSKTIRNWVLTLQPENFLQLTKESTRMGEHLKLYNKFVYSLIYMRLFIYALVWKNEKLHLNSYTNFISEVINIDFGRFGILTWRVLSGWVRNFSYASFSYANCGKIPYVSYTGILTLAKLKYFMSKDLSAKTL